MTFFPLASHAIQKLTDHLDVCESFLKSALSGEHSAKHTASLEALSSLSYPQKARLHRELLEQYIAGSVDISAPGQRDETQLKVMGTLFQLIKEGVPISDERFIGDFEDDPELICMLGPQFQDACDMALLDLMDSKSARPNLFGDPGPLGEGYVYLVQAYASAGFTSGRFAGRDTAPDALIEVPHMLLKAVTGHINYLALLALIRAGVDVNASFKNGILDKFPKGYASRQETSIMQAIVDALQDRVDASKTMKAPAAEGAPVAQPKRSALRP